MIRESRRPYQFRHGKMQNRTFCGGAQILEAIEIDYIDESEVLSPADDVYHINKRDFKVPFVCGARDLEKHFEELLRELL